MIADRNNEERQFMEAKTAQVNPLKMQLFGLDAAQKYGLWILDSKGETLVEYIKCEASEAGTLNLVALEHKIHYAVGKYSLALKPLAAKEGEKDGDAVNVTFELTKELANYANIRLIMKKIRKMEKDNKETAGYGKGVKFFPEIVATIEKLESFFSSGTVSMDELRSLERQAKDALAQFGKIKNERTEAFSQLLKALANVKDIDKVEKVEDETEDEETGGVTRKLQWATLLILAIVLAVIAVNCLVFTAQRGPIDETKALFPNGVNAIQPIIIHDQAAVAPTPPAQVIIVTNTVIVQRMVRQNAAQQNQAPQASQEQSQDGNPVVNLPCPGPGQQVRYTGYIKPGEVLTVMKPQPYDSYNMAVNHYDGNAIAGEWIGQPDQNGIKSDGFRAWLNEQNGPQVICVIVTRK